MDRGGRRACKARKRNKRSVRQSSDQRRTGTEAPESAPVICDGCLHQWECMEQRGRCREYKSKEEIRQQIEMLNKTYKTTHSSLASD